MSAWNLDVRRYASLLVVADGVDWLQRVLPSCRKRRARHRRHADEVWQWNLTALGRRCGTFLTACSGAKRTAPGWQTRAAACGTWERDLASESTR